MRVEHILKSLDELTKRKVKRNAAVWMKKISELSLITQDVKTRQVPVICQVLLTNNLQLQIKSQEILKSLLNKVIKTDNLTATELSILSFTYATIDDDESSFTILLNNFGNIPLYDLGIDDLLQLIKLISLLTSRNIRNNNQLNDDFLHISLKILNTAWDKIKNFNNTSSSILLFSELLTEYIFISTLIGINSNEISLVANHHLIDYSPIISKVKISQFLSKEAKQRLDIQIKHAKYAEVLHNLRIYYFHKLEDFEFVQTLFGRLCNTTGASTFMCRQEARLILDYVLNLLSQRLDSGELRSIYDYLSNIKKTNTLDWSHRSNIRWNYPSLIT